MINRPPVVVNQPEWDRGLTLMVLASGGLHILAIVIVLLIPHSFLHRPPQQQSYVVDIVSSDQLAGTNLVAGGKGRVAAPPAVSEPPAPKVEPPKPPPPKVEEAKPPEPPPEPPKVEPEPPKPQEIAKPPEPKPEPPKVEEKPQENEVALAEKVKKVEPPAPPTVVPSPQAKPPASPKVIAKAAPLKPPPPPSPKIDAKAAKEAAAARERDERIMAAVKRAQQQAGARDGGSGSKAAERPGGPLSVGSGEGAAGTVKGVEYLMYRNQLESRIRQNWAWAGSDQSLEAAIHFSITTTGDIVDVRITHPSGDPSYDRSVERAVRAASPLPPPPDTYRKEFNDVEYTFSPKSLQM